MIAAGGSVRRARGLGSGLPVLIGAVAVSGGLALACGPAARPVPESPARPPAPKAVIGAAASAPASGPAPQATSQPTSAPCTALVIDYELGPRTSLTITDTSLGAGDGTYPVGPGRAQLRFTGHGGEPAAGRAELVALEVTTRFTVRARALGVTTRVLTDATTTLTPDECGVIARGTLDGGRLIWSESARGYRSQGTLTCSGTCGKFGAPPAGRSPWRVGPYPVGLKPLAFHDGLSRFSMPPAQVERSRRPRQTTLLRLEGREIARRCAPEPPCR